MEQGLPAGAGRGSPDDLGQARDEASRKAALRAMAMPAEHRMPGLDDQAGSVAPGLQEVTTHYQNDAHLTAIGETGGLPRYSVSPPWDVADFARLVVTQGIDAAFGHIDALRARGATLEAIYLDLLGPTAQLLGNLWEDDRCDFTEVTIGLGRLHQVLRELGPQFRSEIECVNLGQYPLASPVDSLAGSAVRRLLLVPAEDGQHTFGLQMVADFFARAGWDVWGGGMASGDELSRLLKDEWFDLVGLAAGCEREIEATAADIRMIRAASRNAAVCVMVGGPMLLAHPEFAVAVGADAMAVDARQALREAERLLRRKQNSG